MHPNLKIRYKKEISHPAESMEEGVTTAADFVSSNFHKAEQNVLAAVNSTEHSISSKITDVSKSLKSTISTVGSKVEQAASQGKIFILKSTKDAGGFFTSSFKSVKDWFAQLETEAKELLHFVL
ncbi:unnamed protein product [Orchesella dallaii]|uniref:Uncharacterized protein n=1 Tax=Orchesella dallaii TaxID=48710 RepID=A0ABP1PT98_9HEXA